MLSNQLAEYVKQSIFPLNYEEINFKFRLLCEIVLLNSREKASFIVLEECQNKVMFQNILNFPT